MGAALGQVYYHSKNKMTPSQNKSDFSRGFSKNGKKQNI